MDIYEIGLVITIPNFISSISPLNFPYVKGFYFLFIVPGATKNAFKSNARETLCVILGSVS